jgi:hypothetical protein
VSSHPLSALETRERPHPKADEVIDGPVPRNPGRLRVSHSNRMRPSACRARIVEPNGDSHDRRQPWPRANPVKRHHGRKARQWAGSRIGHYRVRRVRDLGVDRERAGHEECVTGAGCRSSDSGHRHRARSRGRTREALSCKARGGRFMTTSRTPPTWIRAEMTGRLGAWVAGTIDVAVRPDVRCSRRGKLSPITRRRNPTVPRCSDGRPRTPR